MIKIENLTKSFDNTVVLSKLSSNIKRGSIYGLIGTNGAGKSTLLNIISGVYLPDSGSVKINGEDVYENIKIKQKIAYISDEPYFFNSFTMEEMARYLSNTNCDFTMEKFYEVSKLFPLDIKKKINTFSKGMKRQAAIVFEISKKPDIILCDESFDGLDPVIRQLVKRIIINEVADRNMTAVVSSHNLKELENFCDVIGILHENKIVCEKSLDTLKDSFVKLQVAFEKDTDESFLEDFDVVSKDKRSSICELVIRGNKDEIIETMNSHNPILIDVLELTLEDIFIYEMEGNGYDFTKLIM